ncbi:hypothetical protein GCAAIG_06085 [Candidatus Electronema halotolerans]
MKAIQETIGNTQVLIQAMDNEVEVLNSENDGPALVNTGIEDDIKDVYRKAKAAIKNIAEDLGQEFDSIRKTAHAQQMEVEFSMGFSAEAKAWVVFGAKADSGLKVKLTWQGDGE